jgi:hypothetical protein
MFFHVYLTIFLLNVFHMVTIFLITAPSGDSDISCRVNDTVLSLKESVMRQLSAHGKNVRLIFSGKMLDNDQNPLSKYGISDGSFVHAVVTTMRGSGSGAQNSAPPRATNSAPIIYRGFDRLTLIGLSIDETAALRSSFNPQVNEFIESGGHQARNGEDNNAFRYRMEEEWMAAQGARSEFSMNLPSGPGRAATSRRAAQTRDGQVGGETFPMSMASFSFARDRANGTETATERPSNPGTMNDYFWGLAMG